MTMTEPCVVCGEDDDILFTCQHCEHRFCSAHQFPHHACEGVGGSSGAGGKVRTDAADWQPAAVVTTDRVDGPDDVASILGVESERPSKERQVPIGRPPGADDETEEVAVGDDTPTTDRGDGFAGRPVTFDDSEPVFFTGRPDTGDDGPAKDPTVVDESDLDGYIEGIASAEDGTDGTGGSTGATDSGGTDTRGGSATTTGEPSAPAVETTESRAVTGGRRRSTSATGSRSPATLGEWLGQQSYVSLVTKVGIIAVLVNAAFYAGVALTLYDLLGMF
jgi:hypothetical protein